MKGQVERLQWGEALATLIRAIDGVVGVEAGLS